MKLKRGYNGAIMQEEFLQPLLSTLYQLGGKAKRIDVLNKILKSYGDQFNSIDREDNESRGVSRWETNVEWNVHKHRGNLFKELNDFNRGIWQLTDEGMKKARNLQNVSTDCRNNFPYCRRPNNFNINEIILL